LLFPHTALDQQPDPPFYNTTNGTLPAVFKLSNRRTDPDSAEAYCNDVGGHLSQYTSREEQADVEKFYIHRVRGDGSDVSEASMQPCACNGQVCLC
jgi:hypothetical protein